MLEPDVESRPWAEQVRIDGASYRDQLDYLFERSAFYRQKLASAGITSAASTGGLGDIAHLPMTEKQELKATATRENPIGAHLCVQPSEIVRIYSTSVPPAYPATSR